MSAIMLGNKSVLKNVVCMCTFRNRHNLKEVPVIVKNADESRCAAGLCN